MNAKRVDSSAPTPPQCPRCAQRMRLVRRTLRFGGLPDLFTFECQNCGVSHTEEGGPPRETTPKAEIGSWYIDEFGNPTREIKARAEVIAFTYRLKASHAALSAVIFAVFCIEAIFETVSVQHFSQVIESPFGHARRDMLVSLPARKPTLR